jgi:arginyl-tRNA synthetase
VITRDLRRTITRAVAAARFEGAADPGLRPTGTPGQYAASVALGLGPNPRETAETLAGTLAQEQWIETVEVTGPGYLTITVTPEALAAVAENVTIEGPACVTSNALSGVTVPAPPGDPLTAPTWEKARAALATRLTARLAAAAGATVQEFPGTERNRLTHQARTDSIAVVSAARSEYPETEQDARPQPNETRIGAQGPPSSPETAVTRAVAFAGRDAVTFTLARAIPGKPLRVEAEIIARHVVGNPAYAVRYAHARAASGVRWAATSSAADTIGSGETPQRLLADPRSELAGGYGGSPPDESRPGAAAPIQWRFVPAGTSHRDIGRYGGSPPELVVPEGGADTIAFCAIGPARRDIGGYGGLPTREITALLDALSWLPERVATAARRGRPDEFARYLEDLASVTIHVLSSASHPGRGAPPGSDRLTLAMAARTGLAAGLGLLEISAPERLLANTHRGAKL